MLSCLLRALFLVCVMTLVTGGAFAQAQSRSFCVWDPVGASGPMVMLVNGIRPRALGWGVAFSIKTYTDEKLASNDFKAGRCDAVLLNEMMVREFNHFTGTLGAIGAVPGMQELRMLLTSLAQPTAGHFMIDGDHEIAGIVPIGPIYLYVRDRSIDSLEELRGKRIAVFENNQVALNMVNRVGGTVVSATLSSFAGYFKEGHVDIVLAPVMSFEALELYNGMKKSGGILAFPLLQSSMQIVINRSRFDADFGQRLRTYVQSNFEEAMAEVSKAKSAIPNRYWVNMIGTKQDEYNGFLRESRISLMQEGLYDSRALHIMKRVRCHYNPHADECLTGEE